MMILFQNQSKNQFRSCGRGKYVGVANRVLPYSVLLKVFLVVN